MSFSDDFLDDLYREVILDHYRSPRNKGELADAAVVLERNNPVCGDEIRLYLDINGSRLRDVRFLGRGCSISQASASMMTERLKGATLEEVEAVAAAFKAMMHSGNVDNGQDLGDLEALSGVSKFPVRVKCATLAWNTLQEALALYTSGKA